MPRRRAHMPPEGVGQMLLMGKSATIGDLRQRQVAVRQEPPCPVDAPPKDELMGGQAGGQLELADEMGNAEAADQAQFLRSEEHTSELQSLMRISYAVFCLKKKTTNKSNSANR